MPVRNQGVNDDINTGGYETHVTYSKVLGDTTAGANASMPAHTFEGRVTQEIGTH